jgi:PAS domain S-box-containing protein
VVCADGTATTVQAIADRLVVGDDELIVVAIQEKRPQSGWEGPGADVLRTLFDRAPEIITVTGPDGQQLMVNSAGLRLLGFDDALQRPPDGFAFVHPDDLTALIERRAALSAGDAGVMGAPLRIRVRSGDGSWRWLEMLVADLSDVPEVGGRVSFARDVTEAEEQAIALRETGARLGVLIASFRAPALLHDQGGTIIGANDDLAAFTDAGVSGEALVGRHVGEVIEAVSDRVIGAEARAQLAGAMIQGLSLRLDIDLIGDRSYEATYVPIADEDASLGGLWLFHDVSERKRAARRREELLALEREARGHAEVQSELLRRADQARNEFLASLSHELRTPLTSIASATELMLADAEKLDQSAHEYLTMIGRNANRLHRMVEDLLLVGRIAEGMLELELVEVPLTAVVTEAVDALRPLAASRDVTLRVEGPFDARAVVDAFRISQVVDNLVANAIHHSPQGGLVEVAVHVDATTWSLVVDDAGPGIDEADRDTVFERFRRLPSADPSAGAGLGLSIVQGIVALHQGEVRVERSPAGGARFVCSFPFRP